MNKFYHKKFTIIELFIAIAIIALLAAILLPSLFQARVKAHMANDISNLRQVYQAFIYYAEENNGYLPYIQSISNADDNNISKTIWLLLPYMNYNTKVFSQFVEEMDGRAIYESLSTAPETTPIPNFAYSPIYQISDDINDTGILRFNDPTMPNVPIVATFYDGYEGHVLFLLR